MSNSLIAVIPSITISSYESAPPEDMGFFALKSRWERERWSEKAIDEITPSPSKKAVEDQKEDDKKGEDFECELQLSPMDVDKVLVDRVELT